jgi:hypothetical protein
MLTRFTALAALAVLFGTIPASAAEADLLGSLKKGTVELKSAGPLAFGPQGILFVGDPSAGTIYAIDTGDRTAATTPAAVKVEGLGEKIGSLLGTTAKDIQVKDLAVNPLSGNVYLSVARGRGPTAPAVLLRVKEGKIEEVTTKDVPTASAALSNAATAEKARVDAITHLAFVKGRLLVAGLSNEEFSSKLRMIPFPFEKTDRGTSIEIYHGAHGAVETKSPVRVFAPYQIKGEDHILAAYTCTPLVKIPVASLKPGEKVTGTTVAELGNRNRPLAIIVYNKGGKDFALIANNSRGLMKVALENVDSVASINSPIRGGGTAGLKYDKLTDHTGVELLDALGKDNVVLLTRSGAGEISLKTIELP